MRDRTKTDRRLRRGMAAVVILSLGLMITSYALVRLSVSVRDNIFHTGIVEIELNHGAPIISEDDEIFKRFEPGMYVIREFDVTNKSTDYVYYSVYLSQVSGELAKVLEISIWDDTLLLCSGTARELESNGNGGIGELREGETKTLEIHFYYPENAGNETQEATLEFDMCAKAVQKRNNPDRQFE